MINKKFIEFSNVRHHLVNVILVPCILHQADPKYQAFLQSEQCMADCHRNQ